MREHFPAASIESDTIIITNQFGETERIPRDMVDQLEPDPYGWTDSMEVIFDKQGDDNE